MTWHRLFTMCAALELCCLFAASCSLAKVLEVGPGKKFTAPCQAIERAKAGDIVEISPSEIYRGDVCTSTVDHLTIRGIGITRAHIDAAGQSAQGKATWVIAGNDTTVENIEFSGAQASDGNGAGIRQEGANLIVRNCYFHDNQEGILAGDNPKSEILIEFSEFARNGAGDGRTHNIYVNHVAKFTLRFSYSHGAIVGHLVKSRAAENFILYNRLTDETDGSASFEIDLPNGGTSYVIGNIIEQGPETQNSSILGYMLEGADPRNSGTQLYVVNNTFVNDRPQGATFLQIQGGVQTPILVQNNIFYGKGLICTQSTAILKNNLIQKDPRFVDPLRFDYALRSDSPARAAGAVPLQQAGFPLVPKNLYVHVACGAVRKEVPQPDLGALPFDYQTAPRVGPPRCLPSGPGS